MAVRAKILALANKITLEAHTGVPNVPSDPEYRILAEVVTDEQADVAMACKVKVNRTLSEIAKRCGKSPEETKRILYELSSEGVVVRFTPPNSKEELFVLPIWVPGIMEMMVGNKAQVEAHPVIARCFDEYTKKNARFMAPNLPVGMGVMRVIPVEKAINTNNEMKSYEELSYYIENAWKLAVTDCSCRRSRRLAGEGCGHLEKDMCIMLNRSADFQIETGHGHEISKEEAYAILQRAEDNGLIHEVSNIDGTGEVNGICNCCECSCFSLRCGLLYNSYDMLRSNYHAEVDHEKCAACGKCVENCQMNAVRLGQKHCTDGSVQNITSETPHDRLWGKDRWDLDYRENRKTVTDRGTAPCKVNCPAHIAIQGYIRLASEEKYRDALELIKEENPFPAICGRVCPKFCEGACTRGSLDEPIAIDDIKKFIAEQDMNEKHRFVPKMINQTGEKFTEKIAVIGGGPAGLSCAYYLGVKGYPVTVFEKEKKLGGMMTLGIPSFRLEKQVVESEIDVLKEMGIEFKTGVEVGRDISIEELRKQGFKAFYLAIGASKGSTLSCEGSHLGGVITGLDFLRSVNQGKKPPIGKNVAVIGGGNVSIDVARSALRLGAENVYLIYRRGKEEIKADAEEIEDAINEGLKLMLLRSPKKIEGENDHVQRITLEIMDLGAADSSGRRSPVSTGKLETLPVDSVISAIGQKVDLGQLDIGQLQTQHNGTVIADALSYQTNQPDIFAGGDVVTGPRFIIDAVAAGKEGAISIHRFVHDGQTLNIGRDRKLYKEMDKATAAVSIGGYDATCRQHAASVSPAKAVKTFRDLRRVFTEEQIKKEASRCLNCGAAFVDRYRCVGCGICTTKCRFDAIHLVRDGDYISPDVRKLAPYLIGGMARRGSRIAINLIRGKDSAN